MGSFFEGSAPPTATSTTSSAATYPDWYNTYIQTTANRLASAGSQPYVASPIPLTAGLTDDQKGAGTMLRTANVLPRASYLQASRAIDQAGELPLGLDTAQPYLQNATKTFTGDTVNDYLNPFNTAVTDRLGVLAGRNLSENLLPKVNDTFIGSGQFGSSGNSEFTSRALRDTQEGLLGQQASTLQDQYNKSAGIFNQDATRSLGAANTAGNLANQDKYSTLAVGNAAANLGNTMFSNNLQQSAGLATLGNRAQDTDQRALDAANAEFARQRDYPMLQAQYLANNSNAIRPQAGVQSVSTKPLNETMQPSGAQSVLGGVSSAAGIGKTIADSFPETLSSIGSFFGFKDGGMVGRYADGGLNIDPGPDVDPGAPGQPYPSTMIPTWGTDGTSIYDPVANEIAQGPLPVAQAPMRAPQGGLNVVPPIVAQPQGGLSVMQEAPAAQPAVDPIASLRARADTIYNSVRPPEERLQALQAARDKLASKSEASLGADKLLALGAGLLAPTRTGSFSEALGNAAGALVPINERERRAKLDQEGRLLSLDQHLADAGLRADDRLLSNATRMEQRANQAEFTRDRLADRKEQAEARKEEWAQRAADRKVQQSIAAGHLDVARAQLSKGNWEPAAPGPDGEDGAKSTVFVNRNDGTTKVVSGLDYAAMGSSKTSAERDKAALYETLLDRAEKGDEKAARTLDLLRSASANPEAAARGFAHIYEKISQDPQYIGMSEDKKIEAAKRIYQEATTMARQPSRLGGSPAAETPPGAAAPSASPYKDGQTAINPDTKKRIVFRNGKWEDL